ncbi:CBS domain-containing protein [Actinacidiphila acidipaludis]|uniref:CBS domain-containing protein n=1 Tax=Actinacidiphila acidipaludis TaxID=2873382 RepID=A0ABS7PZD4_9ACTN|nr:CBS domain-containing protein [Streptomyces acidipaludis]MBY8876245.1 CBS domain-containing protein [Streptomyces acidipaludis]
MTKHRTVSDLMTHSVHRVHADTPFKEIAKTLADHDITAVPVVDDDDRPIGVVSEADLLRREAALPDTAGLLAILDIPPLEPGRAPTTARTLMSAPVVAARPAWTVVQAARIMDHHGVKRLPVVDDTGRLVGIISRADLLRIFLRRDHLIREEISGDILDRMLGISADEVGVDVSDGRVTLHGTVERRSLVPVVKRLCEGVDGVVEVTGTLDYRTDEAVAVSSPQERTRVLP